MTGLEVSPGLLTATTEFEWYYLNLYKMLSSWGD
jgi:hypothetical protein